MNHESATAIKRAAREQGMLTMREERLKKALNGITTIQEVNRRTRVDEPLEKLVRTRYLGRSCLGEFDSWPMKW